MINFGHPKNQPLPVLLERIQEMARASKQSSDKRQRARIPGTPLPAEILHLPIWPEETRGVPNCILRSALFSVSETGGRPYLENAKIEALSGIKIRYTGVRLDQGDLQVWQTLLHLLRTKELGAPSRVSASEILRAMGKTDSGGNRAVLSARLQRLHSATLSVQVDVHHYEGRLVDEAGRDIESKQWVIRLNRRLLDLFGKDQFTQIQWNVCAELSGKPLSQWLHGYYSSHAKPFAIKTETLLKLAGSENLSVTSGRQMLRRSLDALAQASTNHGHTFCYEIRDNLVFVKKSGSASQRRSLVKGHKKQRS